ncbi:hypothetical protein BDV24DRAFT_163129 [Aspergillus arachidicola]|uniref:Zn(2)-C6 fungal-type domain-containing protein n=1 Tax=Aspergillus arachidicola TaxID=656916 RepID=A0A5N6Y8Y7_9EURO|nr:hypothetical protein BDV24DRAFT_163129 [Aspergillus arachidicola]
MPSQPPSPHVGVIVNPSARRVACDQCHAQKLRCTKLEDCTVCIRCQRLNRQCIWSPPARNGRPARTTAERASRPDHKKRRKRSSSVLEMTPENSAQEHVRSSSISTAAQPTPPAVEVPPLGPPSIADWNMSYIFNFSSPCDSSRDNLFPSLWTPDSVPPMPNLTDYFQMPANGLGTQPRIPDERSAPSLDSLQDITRELSNVNLLLFDLEQSLHAEPWGLMFASPTAVITKLSTCGGDQPDDTLTHGYPLIDIFKKTQRFIDIAKQTSIYVASLPTPPASTSTSSTGRPSSTAQPPSWHAWHPDSDTSSQGSSPFSPPVDLYMPRHMPPPYSASSSATTRGDRPATSDIDLPTALLFTTGYARILDLYMTVLTQMSHFVHALSVQSMTGGPDYRQIMHPVIPPLQWDGFQPANYGALQILMVIQVISYLLTEVERVLGVDEWEREVMSEPSRSEERRSCSFAQMGQARRRDLVVGDGAGSGLLSSAMIELVVQGEGPGNRRGKVGLLRRKLRRLKKDLEKSSIESYKRCLVDEVKLTDAEPRTPNSCKP